MSFADVINTDLPRLVVQFSLGEDGDECFMWGTSGKIPILSLLGEIIRSQADLLSGAWMPDCAEYNGQFVIAFYPIDRVLDHYLSKDVPRLPLAGMLETIKAALLGGRVAQHSGATKVQLYGPTGLPIDHANGAG